jgi:peptidoglycan hydrolase-like protein with peptidoglycan-binding domain
VGHRDDEETLVVTAPPPKATLPLRYMRRAIIVAAAVLGLTLLPVPGAPSSTASAAPTDIVAVVVDGTGNGHGRGMSQWGAYGWAVDQGWTWTQILDHYYGGTSMGSVDANGTIKVRLLGLDGAGTVGLVSHGEGVVWNGSAPSASMQAVRTANGTFDIYKSDAIACADTSTLVVPDGPLAVGASGDAVRQVQQFLTVFGFEPGGVDGSFGNLTAGAVTRFQASRSLAQDGVWRIEEAVAARSMIAAGGSAATFVKIGTAASAPVFTTASGATATTALGLCQPNGSVIHYRGSIQVSNQSGATRVVNDVRVEDYLRGVVPKEISASWAQAGGGAGANAVRAQAVAARSYALQQNRYPPYAATCDSQSCQVYGGSATRAVATGPAVLVEDLRTDQAIAATAGTVRRWPNGAIVSTEFSASNGPRTAGGAFPPVDDAPGDSTVRNPNHRWTRILDADALAEKYGLGSITAASMVEAASSAYRQYDGIWFNDVVLTGSNGRQARLNAWDFRGANGLPSPGFTIRVVTRDSTDDRVAFVGDSVGESSRNEFVSLTDGMFSSLTYNTLTSRFITKTPPSPSGVQVARSLPTDLDVVAVELGYNPSNNMAADIDAMMEALTERGARRVIWINMAEIRRGPGGSSFYGAANAALTAARSRWPNLVVADWNATSAGAGIERSRWISSDGIHLTATGQAQFALWTRQLLGGNGPVGGNGPGDGVAPSRRFAPNQRIELPVVGERVVGADGVARTVPANASAVALNITAVGPSAPGYVTVWPCDVARPEASNLNFVANAVVANGVIAPVGDRGTVCFFSNQATDLLVDIAGWFSGASGGSPTFVGAAPKRLLDTRNAVGGPRVRIPAGGTITLPMAGAAMQRTDGVAERLPANATAVAMNVTAVGPSQAGYFTVWPCGAPRPEASNVNFAPGSVVANGVVASLGSGGAVCIYSSAESDVLVDVLGWFSDGAGRPPYVGSVPLRLVDTRNAIGGPRGVITPNAPKAVPVRGVTVVVDGVAQRVPADATAVALNVTMTETQGDGYATVWPCGTPRPEASNVNFTKGATVANGVVAPVGADGSVCIYTFANSHLLVDIAGWFTGGTEPAFVGNNPKRLVDTRNDVGPAPI